MSDYLLKIAERVAKVEKLREGEMLDNNGNVVRAGDTIRLVAYGWDVPVTAVQSGAEFRVSRVTGGGQAIVPYHASGRLSGVMRVRSECMLRVRKSRKLACEVCGFTPAEIACPRSNCPQFATRP